MPKTQDVEKVPASDVQVVSTREQLAKDLLTKAITEMARPEQTPLEMALAIMQAETNDQVFGGTVLHMRDMIGVHFLATGASLTESSYEEGLPAFAVITAQLDDGSNVVITTGAVNCVAALINWHARGEFPIYVNTVEEETKKGFKIIKFVRPTQERPTVEQLKAF